MNFDKPIKQLENTLALLQSEKDRLTDKLAKNIPTEDKNIIKGRIIIVNQDIYSYTRSIQILKVNQLTDTL